MDEINTIAGLKEKKKLWKDLINYREPSGWPVITKVVIRLYDLLIPYYQKIPPFNPLNPLP